jgi:hypothetical protein
MTLNWFPPWNWQFKERHQLAQHNKSSFLHAVTFSPLQLRQNRRKKKSQQKTPRYWSHRFMGTRSGAFLPRLLYVWWSQDKNKQTRKHLQQTSTWIVIHLERDSLSEIFLPTNRYQLLFFPTTTKKVFLKWCEAAIFLISKIKYFRRRRRTRRSRRRRLIRNFGV